MAHVAPVPGRLVGSGAMHGGAGPWSRSVGAALLLLGLLAGCSGGDPDRPSAGASRGSRTPPPPSSPASSAPAALGGLEQLSGAYSCRGGFTCGSLEVPLDHDDPAAGTTALQVAIETDDDAPRGVLLALNGGPGAAGAPLAPEIAERLGPEVMADYRLVALDQRGTGPSALDCPALQTSSGQSFVPAPSAVRACASTLGATRALFGTDDTVADLEDLRAVLEADEWTVFAVSYGTYVAQQYAVAYPGRVAGLVLDSPLPAGGPDTLELDTMRATGRVLRSACAAQKCAGDPVADLAAVVRRDGDGPDLLGLVTGMSSVRPAFDTLLPALGQARSGDRADLDRLLQAYRTGFATTAAVFSAGLHSAAYCGDQVFPWGRSSAPVERRGRALRAVVARLGASATYPFDARTVAGASGVVECRAWPPVEPSAVARGRVQLPRVPVLLLAGEHDLSAPLESVRGSAADQLPGSRLVVVRGAGHVVTATPGRGRAAVRDFLLR